MRTLSPLIHSQLKAIACAAALTALCPDAPAIEPQASHPERVITTNPHSASSASPPIVNADDTFRFIAINDDTAVFARPIDIQAQTNSVHRIWSTWVFRHIHPTPSGDIKHLLALADVDCSSGRYIFLQSNAYNERRELVPGNEPTGETSFAAPQTLAANLVQAACKPPSDWRTFGAVTLPPDSDPLEFADSVVFSH